MEDSENLINSSEYWMIYLFLNNNNWPKFIKKTENKAQ